MNTERWDERTLLLLGEEKLNKLQRAHVLIVGLGGVGAYAAEQLGRAGIGQLTLVDFDKVNPSNRNRQLPALKSTQGLFKADILQERLLDINPDLNLTVRKDFIKDELAFEILNQPFDYVVDAIDTLAPKVFFIHQALQLGHQLVSSMGAGGKLNPSLVQVDDVSKSHSCKLAYHVRKRLHQLGVKEGFKVVFSPEEVSRESIIPTPGDANKKTTVGTISYMPAIFGCYVSSVVIRDLIEK